MSLIKHIEFYLNCGENSLNAEDYDRAIELFTQAINICDDFEAFEELKVEGLLNLAYCFSEKDMYGDSLKFAIQAMRLDPNSEWGWRLIGIACGELNYLKEAVEAFTKAIEIEPDGEYVAWNHQSRGEVYRLLGIIDKADKDFRKALEEDPKSEFLLSRRRACGAVVKTNLPVLSLWRPQLPYEKWNIFHSNKNIVGMANGNILSPNEFVEDKIILPGLGDVLIKVLGRGLDMNLCYSDNSFADDLVAPFLSHGKNVTVRLNLEPLFLGINDALQQSKNISLLGLEFSNCELGEHDLRILHQLLPEIHHLEFVECNQLSESSIKEIGRFKKLQHLRMEKVTDSFIHLITEIGGLESLYIDRSPELSDNGIQKLEMQKTIKKVIIRDCKNVTRRVRQGWKFI